VPNENDGYQMNAFEWLSSPSMLINSISYGYWVIWHGRGHRFDPDQVHHKLFRMSRSPFLADGLPERNGADDGVESGALTARIAGIKWA
jgi:hypothetical protein